MHGYDDDFVAHIAARYSPLRKAWWEQKTWKAVSFQMYRRFLLIIYTFGAQVKWVSCWSFRWTWISLLVDRIYFIHNNAFILHTSLCHIVSHVTLVPLFFVRYFFSFCLSSFHYLLVFWDRTTPILLGSNQCHSMNSNYWRFEYDSTVNCQNKQTKSSKSYLFEPKGNIFHLFHGRQNKFFLNNDQ